MKPLDKKNLPYLILFAAAIPLLWRATLSFCWSDESFYFSTAGRFLSGDKIFADEWFPTQLVSLILLPPQGLYRLITGGYDGIILYFRILYVAFSFLTSCLIYKILAGHKGTAPALICAIWYEFYVHLNIATLSYYTLSMGFFLLSMLLIYDGIRAVRRRDFIASGFCLALSVLSLPTLAAAYFAVVTALLITAAAVQKYRKNIITGLLYHLAGIIPPAAIVLIYVMAASGIFGIVDNLGYVLSDEEHRTSLVYPFKNFFLSVFDIFGRPAVYAALLLFLAGLICGFIPRLRGSKLPLCSIAAADFLLLAALLPSAAGHTGFGATALVLFALPILALTKSGHRDALMFITLFMGGMVFSMVFSYSSMCDLYVLSIGHNIAAIAGICFVSDFYGSLPEDGVIWRIIGSLAAVAVCVCLLHTVYLRFVNIYRDAPVSRLTTRLDDGVAAGLYTTPEHGEMYRSLLGDIERYCASDGNVFFTKLLPWGYLSTDMGCGAPTTWRTLLSSERLELYYKAHPDKLPDIIFVMKDTVGSYESCGDVESDPTPNTNETGGFLGGLIRGDGYERIECEYCTIYRKDGL